jgi:hypothetical protein
MAAIPDSLRRRFEQRTEDGHIIRFALHGKLLTTGILASRGWTHNPVCPLCLNALETTIYLCKDRPFSAAVWTLVQD